MNNLRIRRFTPLQRLFHFLLILSFLIQAATGLCRMYIETAWGQRLGRLFGGYDAALEVHKIVGLLMIVGFIFHAAFMLIRVNWKHWKESLFGPDSIVPGTKDAAQFFQHLGWFLGMRRAPEFDRWGYWEKFDYWAVFWGMVIIGVTGLLLAYPIASSRLMPGWGLNVAFWIHRIEALLAIGHVFIIHFFIAHLRRRNFPMDRTMFEGSADLHAVHHERPLWIARLDADGRLVGLQVPEAVPIEKGIYYVFGLTAVAFGLYLLIGAIVNAPQITW